MRPKEEGGKAGVKAVVSEVTALTGNKHFDGGMRDAPHTVRYVENFDIPMQPSITWRTGQTALRSGNEGIFNEHKGKQV